MYYCPSSIDGRRKTERAGDVTAVCRVQQMDGRRARSLSPATSLTVTALSRPKTGGGGRAMALSPRRVLDRSLTACRRAAVNGRPSAVVERSSGFNSSPSSLVTL